MATFPTVRRGSCSAGSPDLAETTTEGTRSALSQRDKHFARLLFLNPPEIHAMFLNPRRFVISAHCCLTLLCAGLLFGHFFGRQQQQETSSGRHSRKRQRCHRAGLPDRSRSDGQGQPQGKSFEFSMRWPTARFFAGTIGRSTRRRLCARSGRSLFTSRPHIRTASRPPCW